MSRHVFKLPDLGEGTVSAEIVAWHVKPGDTIAEDQALAEMSTDKAVVEVPSPVSGRVISLNGQPGDAIAVGAELAVIETDAGVGSGAPNAAAAATVAAASIPQRVDPAPQRGRIMASPATRRRAREAGIDQIGRASGRERV